MALQETLIKFKTAKVIETYQPRTSSENGKMQMERLKITKLYFAASNSNIIFLSEKSVPVALLLRQ